MKIGPLFVVSVSSSVFSCDVAVFSAAVSCKSLGKMWYLLSCSQIVQMFVLWWCPTWAMPGSRLVLSVFLGCCLSPVGVRSILRSSSCLFSVTVASKKIVVVTFWSCVVFASSVFYVIFIVGLGPLFCGPRPRPWWLPYPSGGKFPLLLVVTPYP